VRLIDPDLESLEAGPKRATSLVRRGLALAAPAEQLRVLDALPVADLDFDARIAAAGLGVLRPATLEYFQMNLGKLCNMT
jgi:hypothetical protein